MVHGQKIHIKESDMWVGSKSIFLAYGGKETTLMMFFCAPI
jgi:hypothetical protein